MDCWEDCYDTFLHYLMSTPGHSIEDIILRIMLPGCHGGRFPRRDHAWYVDLLSLKRLGMNFKHIVINIGSIYLSRKWREINLLVPAIFDPLLLKEAARIAKYLVGAQEETAPSIRDTFIQLYPRCNRSNGWFGASPSSDQVVLSEKREWSLEIWWRSSIRNETLDYIWFAISYSITKLLEVE